MSKLIIITTDTHNMKAATVYSNIKLQLTHNSIIITLTDLLTEGHHTRVCLETYRCLDASDTALSASS